MTLTALEFYSGIGAFAQAARNFDLDIVSSFDQSEWANTTYLANYDARPHSRNLDSIEPERIPGVDLWWMSPPCTPFSRRGEQKDSADNRARSFLHLIEMLALRGPEHLLIENVEGFADSEVRQILHRQLDKLGYSRVEIRLCATDFGVPMQRPRFFVVASRSRDLASGHLIAPAKTSLYSPCSITDFLDEPPEHRLYCEPAMLARFDAVLNIVDVEDEGSQLICFTSSYKRSRRASGSLIRRGDGPVRFLSPAEILKLLGFAENYRIPSAVPEPMAYRLVGNSVDVRAIKYLLKEVLQIS